jgi:predicted TIM-barrel fold metal-dependent hydrolase
MAKRYDGPIVDTDIHHGWADWSELVAYLPKEWRDYAATNPRTRPRGGVVFLDGTPHGAMRRDAYPEDGTRPGSSYELMKEQVLDRYNIWRGLLTFNVGHHPLLLNTSFGTALARAAHDWNADTWLTYDERLYGLVSPNLNDPQEAAKEVRRAGKNPKIISVLMAAPSIQRAYGDPVYHPVYEAAAELGLVIDLHPGSINGEHQASGKPLNNTGQVPMFIQQAMHHITSFIVHGVFEKYPTTKVLIKEHGLAWLPHLMWRLDQSYELLKLESPWVKKLPSEYIFEHIRLNTQPLEEGERPGDLTEVLTSIDGIENLLCFGTDYPHLSFDEPGYIAQSLPAEWSRKVMCDNACELYGWTPPPANAVFEPLLAATG